MDEDRSPGDRGAVTAEAVMVLPMLLAVTVGLVWLLAVGAGQIRMIDAARETARAVARGDSQASAVGLGERIAPGGSRIAIANIGDRVVVNATGQVNGPGGLFTFLPSVRLQAESVALMEEAGGGDLGVGDLGSDPGGGNANAGFAR